MDAEARCATASMLEKQVRERSPRIRFVEDASEVPRLVVRMGPGVDPHPIAELSIQWPDGRRSERRLTARDCASALDALALLLAMTLDPDVLSPQPSEPGIGGPARAEAAHGTSVQSAATPEPASAPAPNEPPEQDRPARQPLEGESPQRNETATASTPRHPRPLGLEHAAVGVHVQVALGMLPKALPGVGVHALFALNGTEWWAPALQLQFVHAWRKGLEQPAGDAAVQLDSVELGVCPLGLRVGPFAARACAGGSVGLLKASGSGSYTPQTHSRPWGNLGGAALLSVALGRWVQLQGAFGVVGPLTRYGFAFRPEVFHRIPAAYFSSHFGAGVRFP